MRRRDCCDGCRKSKGCEDLIKRCWPEDGAKLEKCKSGQDCRQCFKFEDTLGLNPCYERMDLEIQRKLIRVRASEKGCA